MAAVPTVLILKAFNLTGEIKTLSGGQGQSVCVDDAVLKPVENIDDTEFVSRLQSQLIRMCSAQYRLAEPLIASNGDYTFQNWSASRVIAGQTGVHSIERWTKLLVAAHHFHADLKRLVTSPPAFIECRRHRWARADRCVWLEPQLDGSWGLISIPALSKALGVLHRLDRNVPDGPNALRQLVHCDLSGNVLFTPDKDKSPPGIIDLSLYWRPPAYAEAVVIAEALIDHGCGQEVVHLVGLSEYRLEMLRLALLFRIMACNEGIKETGGDLSDRDRIAFERAVDILAMCMAKAGLYPHSAFQHVQF